VAVTLDTGALVAADRNDRRFWAWWKRATALSVVATVPHGRDPRRRRTRDVVDACVAVVAALGGDDVPTGDPDDLAPLMARLGATGRALTLESHGQGTVMDTTFVTRQVAGWTAAK
jgi:hypothetical protein